MPTNEDGLEIVALGATAPRVNDDGLEIIATGGTAPRLNEDGLEIVGNQAAEPSFRAEANRAPTFHPGRENPELGLYTPRMDPSFWPKFLPQKSLGDLLFDPLLDLRVSPIHPFPGEPSRGEKLLAGGLNVAMAPLEGISSPAGIATLGTGALGGTAGRVVSAAFAADMARHLPEQAMNVYEAFKLDQDEQAKLEALGGLGTGLLFTAAAGAHAGSPERVPMARELAEKLGREPLTPPTVEPPAGYVLDQPARTVQEPFRVGRGVPLVPGSPEDLAARVMDVRQAVEQSQEAQPEPSAPSTAEPEPVPAASAAPAAAPAAAAEPAPELSASPAEAPAAMPESPQDPGMAVTSTKNAQVDIERQRRGLPPAMEPARREFGTVWDQAMALIGRDPEVQNRLVEELRNAPRALTDTENALLLHRQIELQNEYGRLADEQRTAYDEGKESPARAADAEELKLRVAGLSDRLQDLYDINKRTGTETGRGLAARRMMAYEDFSLAKMEIDKRAANDGRPLTDTEREELAVVHEKIERTQKAFDDYVAKTEAEKSDRAAAEAVRALQVQAGAETPLHPPEIASLADRIVKGLEAQANEARARIKARLSRASAGIDPTVLYDLAVIGASHIAKGARNFAQWSDRMMNEFGEDIRDHLAAIWQSSNKRLDAEVGRVAGKRASATHQAVRQIDPTEQRQRIVEGIAKAAQDGRPPEDLGRYIQKLALNFVRSGVKDAGALLDAVHGEVAKVVPELGRRDVMDAISGYGKFKMLDREAAKVKLRELKGEMQQAAKLQDLERRVPLKKTGTERRPVGDEERRLIKMVNEAKRKFGVVVTDPATQLRSALDAIKTRLRNGIADIEYQIATKARTVKTRTPAPFDAETELLRVRRDALRQQLDDLLPRKPMSDEQRATVAQRGLEQAIAELENRIKARDVSTPAKRAAVTTPEIEALRARRDALREEYAELHEVATGALEARKLEALKARADALAAQINEGDIATKPRGTGAPKSPAVEAATAELAKLREMMATMRRAATARTPEQRALQSLKTRLANSSADYTERLARGDFAAKPRKELVLDPEAQRLKAENEKAKQAFRAGLAKDRWAKRTMSEKVQDTFLRWRRGFLLSGPVTLAKLTAAAVQRLAITPIEEAVGGAYSKVFPRLAERAPREGGFNSAAEAKALTEGFMRGIQDAWQQLKTGKSNLDTLFGRGRETGIGESDAETRSVIDFFGNLHGALKSPVKRAEFARSFEKRIAWNIRQGVDVSDPMVQTRISVEAYKDAKRSIFMQDNRVVSAYKWGLMALEQPDKATGKAPLTGRVAATTLKTLLPIVKVPTNIVAETFVNAFGSVTGSVRLARAYARGIERLHPDEADVIMRQLKKGSLGLAVLSLGYFAPQMFGGYYQRGQKREDNAVKFGSARVGGVDVPSFLLHNPLLEVAQLGATIRRVADAKIKKTATEPQGLPAGIWAGLLGLGEEVPFARETIEVAKAYNPEERGAFVGELTKSIAIPTLVQTLARWQDRDLSGETVPRKPETVWQHVETGLPYLRTNVPPRVPHDDAVERIMRRLPRGTPREVRDARKLQLYQQMHPNSVPKP